MKSAQSTFEVISWDEKAWAGEVLPLKATRASVSYRYRGGWEGESHVEYTMVYRDDGGSDFVGLEVFSGSLEGRAGSFVLRHRGIFQGGAVKAHVCILSESGTGDLRGLVGEGEMFCVHGKTYEASLEWSLPE